MTQLCCVICLYSMNPEGIRDASYIINGQSVCVDNRHINAVIGARDLSAALVSVVRMNLGATEDDGL